MLPLHALLLPLAILTAVAPTMAAGASPAAGQSCPPAFGGAGLALEAGAVGYDVADGISGVGWGVDGIMTPGRVSVELGYRRITLRQSTTSPDLLRGAVRAPVMRVGGWSVCGVVHAGGSRYVADAGRGSVLAGGLGLALARPITAWGTTVLPHAEVRGLGARASGTVLDIEMDGSGLSLGVEAGASVPVGRVVLRLAGSMDGFASGLGVTPYPARALRLAVGYRF